MIITPDPEKLQSLYLGMGYHSIMHTEIRTRLKFTDVRPRRVAVLTDAAVDQADLEMADFK